MNESRRAWRIADSWRVIWVLLHLLNHTRPPNRAATLNNGEPRRLSNRWGRGFTSAIAQNARDARRNKAPKNGSGKHCSLSAIVASVCRRVDVFVKESE